MKVEDRVAKAFKIMRGGKDNLGVKEPWWTKEYEQEKREWFTSVEVSDAEWIVLDVVNRFESREKDLIRIRCGAGFVKGYRKCGKELKVHHEYFRQLFQPIKAKLKKILDEKPVLGQ